MLPGKGVGNRGCDQVEIELQRVDLLVSNLPGLGQSLENSVLIQTLGRVVGSFHLKRADHVDDRDWIADPRLGGRGSLPHGPYLLQLAREPVLLGHDLLTLTFGDEAKFQKNLANVVRGKSFGST